MWELETKSFKQRIYGRASKAYWSVGQARCKHFRCHLAGGLRWGPSLQDVAPPLSYGAIGRSIVVAAPGW